MTRRRHSESINGWSTLTDLMSIMSFGFLLMLGVAIVSSGTQKLLADGQSLSVEIAKYKLSQLENKLVQLEVARLVQDVLDQSRSALMEELLRPDLSGASVFRTDDLGAGVKLDADILFGLGDAQLRATPEVNQILVKARQRMCMALLAFQQAYQVPPGAEGLADPFDYLELSFEGHADRSRNPRLSNWALSAQRATSLLESFVVPESESVGPRGTAPCRDSDDGAPELDARVIRVVASGRGSMDAGACGNQERCDADRYALLRVTIRMDRVFRDLDAAFESRTRVTPDQ